MKQRLYNSIVDARWSPLAELSAGWLTVLSRRSSLLLAAAAVTAMVWPQTAQAECGPLDAGGCVDGALYRFWEGLAALGWWFDRTLLMGAYQLDTLRWWLVEVAFTSAYQALVQTLTPFLAPIAVTATILACLAFLLLPIAGRIRLFNIRHVLTWAVLAPALLTVSGPMVAQLEQARSGVGTALYTAVGSIAPGAIFGTPGSDMRGLTPLYPANPCGTTLSRPSGNGLRLDDLAAALLWADAEDIHCPDIGGPGRDIPDAFYDAIPEGAGYAVDQDVSMLPPGTPRSEAVRSMQRGVVRTFIGLLPSILALLDALVQLVFALSLVALWISLPISLLMIFFDAGSGILTGLFRRLLQVLQVSWSSSVLMGLVTACLIAAAELRNAAAYTGFAIGGGALVVYLLKVGVETFTGCLRTLSATAQVLTGLSGAEALATGTHAVQFAGSTGVALAGGGALAALVAAGAYRQTGSGAYAAGTLAGRIRPIAAAAEAGALAGLVDPQTELLAGLYAGYRSEQSLRSARLQIQADAQKTDASGLTMRERADERRITRAYERRQHAEQTALSAPMPQAIQRGWEHARQAWERAAAESLPPGVSPAEPHEQPQAQPVYVLQRGQITTRPAPAVVPAHALSEEARQVHIPRLLMLGYSVMEQPGQGVTFWRGAPEATAASATRRSPSFASQADERSWLVRHGAVLSMPAAPPTVASATPEEGGRNA